MSRQPLKDPVVEQAIAWLVQIQSGDFSPAQLQELEQWCATSEHHRQVYERLIAGLDHFKTSPWRGRSSEQLLRSLEQPNSRRSFLRNSLCVLGAVASVGWFTRYDGAGQAYATATGERRSWHLADGSTLSLNARSKVVATQVGDQLRLELQGGQILVNALRPLQVSSQGRRISDFSGRLMLSEQGDALRLVTLDSDALLRLADGALHQLAKHQSTLFDQQRILSKEPMSATESAWLDGWIVVRNQTLATVVDALRPYQRGFMRLDAAVAGLRVTGRFPLDNAPQTFEALEQSLPIKVTQWGTALVLIGARGG